MARCEWVCLLLVLSVMTLARSAWASNQFNEAGNGNLASGVNWSLGAPPLPGSEGKFTGTGNVNTFLSSDLSAGQFSFNRPFGQFNIDLQGHTLTSDGLALFPLVTGTTDPFTGGLNLRDGTVLGRLSLDSGSPTLQKPPHTVTSSISNVTWTGQQWFINGKQAINAPGFEDSGKVNVTIDQGSKVTLDRLLVSRNGSVNVSGPDTELGFNTALILGQNQLNPSLAEVFAPPAMLRAVNGATVRTLKTDPPITLPPIPDPIGSDLPLSFIRKLELDGAGTRMVANDANIRSTEIRISNGAAIETNRPLYSFGEVNISNATASHDLISLLGLLLGPSSGFLLQGTGLEHAVKLDNSTLYGNVTGFRYVDLHDSILNGNVQGVEAIRGEGVINGNLLPPGFSPGTIPPGFLPTGLIDLNGDVFRGVYMQALFTGPPDANTPRVEVDTIDHLPTLDWLLNSDEPFGFEVDFEELFHASLGDRFELFKSLSTVLNPGILAPGDLSTVSPVVRDVLEERLSGIRLGAKPAGYEFDVFVEPHAIGFTVVAVPELSTFAMLTPPLLLMAILQARRLGKQRMIALT